ncbi:hypothetical protein [Pantoea sp. B65]|uniref:hypothetical protein n=1 Tax=Pantoea sp. B65 TaxID=2813359 RepID=UPI0039B559DB
MIKHRFTGLLLATCLVSFGAAAVSADQVIKPVRGTVDAVSDNSLRITTRQGEKMVVKLTDKTRVNSISKAQISDIKADSFIGSAAVAQANGTLEALEVHIFAPELRGSGEGFNPFQSADGNVNTMTNGTVGNVVNSHGRTLTVKYHDKEKTIIVPDNVPVVLISPGNRSLLQPGTKVVLSTMKDEHGDLVARGVSAGKDGLTPPM